MSATIFIPRDSGAVAVGADEVAAAVAREAQRRGLDVTIVRNGSRGAYWLEPMVEVATPNGRVTYGPVKPSDVAGLFDFNFTVGAWHALGHGLTEEIPFFKQQTRLTFARCGITDPLSLDDYKMNGGFAGLEKAVGMQPAEIVAIVMESGLRGRGGAGFPTASNGRRRWRRKAPRNTSSATPMRATAAPSPTG